MILPKVHAVTSRLAGRAYADTCRSCYLAQKILRELKSKISSQSKKNFVLEKDVRYLDSRIALLIQNRMALEEVHPKSNPDHIRVLD